MPKFSVPVIIEISGHLVVDAESAEEAIEKAKKMYEYRRFVEGKDFIHSVDSPDTFVGFAGDDDPDEVELVEE